MSSIQKMSWPSQWRFQISAQIHPKFELASQSVVIKKAHPKGALEAAMVPEPGSCIVMDDA
jgi:hypothetical protein